jgi:hypothetical protein
MGCKTKWLEFDSQKSHFSIVFGPSVGPGKVDNYEELAMNSDLWAVLQELRATFSVQYCYPSPHGTSLTREGY